MLSHSFSVFKDTYIFYLNFFFNVSKPWSIQTFGIEILYFPDKYFSLKSKSNYFTDTT